MKTYHPKKEEVQQKWWLINADGQILGRLATEIAVLLRGKNKPQFVPSVDVGDYVIVVNSEKIKVTGNKLEDKIYHHHSLYPGGLREKNLKKMLETKPEEVIRNAVWGMIPKNKLGRTIIKKLKVYRGPEHPHQAQNPEEYKF
jgi:large subunit ribosomal protein L13